VQPEIRAPTQDELRAAMAAANSAFGEGLEDTEFERRSESIPLDRVLAAFDGGRPVGLAAAREFELTIPGAVVPAAGVTWVGVPATHRRRGILSALMRRQLDDLHERGEVLAPLWASEAAIYGRFGYGLASFNLSIEADRHSFALRDDPGPSGSCRFLEPDEATAVCPEVYERMRTGRAGMLSRSERLWTGRLHADPPEWRDGGGPKFVVLLELGGRPVAYARYRVHDKWERSLPAGEVRVYEAIATSPEATRELWRFLFGIDLVTTVRADFFDAASPLLLMVQDVRRLRPSLNDGLWLRLVDVGKALRLRSFAAAGSVVLDVSDPFCPWNEGRFRAGEDAGPTGAAPELRLSVADLASAYLGAFDLEHLASAGRVEELVPGALAHAAALFRTALPPFCPEEF